MTDRADECVVDTCRFSEGTHADGNLRRGYEVCCVVTASDHDCSTEPRVLFYDDETERAAPVGDTGGKP